MEVEVKKRVHSNEWTDRLGSFASSLCALHCAVCGLLPVAFTALGLGFLLNSEVEWILSITAIVLGLGALVLGWRQHRSLKVAGLLAIGIVGIIASRGLEVGLGHEDHHGFSHNNDVVHVESTEHIHDHQEELHASEHAGEHEGAAHENGDLAHFAGTLVGVFAGLLLLFGHILNIRLARRCREECCDTPDNSTLKPVEFRSWTNKS